MRRLLVANRGEIAVRVLRAARDLGLETVAVYSSADADAPHVTMADVAIEIGPPPAPRSYLDIAAIVAAAQAAEADAVHPGYGFLAERADFARACVEASLTWVGPDAATIEQLGDKVRARATAQAAGVPVLPGTEGPVASLDEARAAASAIGYPVILKAAGGGGGRGLRVIRDDATLLAQLPIAEREAESAFGDSRLYVERFLERARHVEVQVLGDGVDVVALHERDCSLQRRRQKVIEEAPAPALPADVRARAADAAERLCRAVGYRGAGTAEFMFDLDSGDVFFIEMNTRIQVEHPVTELITGIDLVVEQLRIAAGAPLPTVLAAQGCALELRLCAEDTTRGFAPSPGQVTALELPAGPWVRVDTWLRAGSTVPPFYDSLLAKIVVWGPDRETVLRRARRALAEVRVEGIATTLPMLQDVLDEEWFADVDFDTRTLETWLDRSPVSGPGAAA